jgi:hypothetical protein
VIFNLKSHFIPFFVQLLDLLGTLAILIC